MIQIGPKRSIYLMVVVMAGSIAASLLMTLRPAFQQSAATTPVIVILLAWIAAGSVIFRDTQLRANRPLARILVILLAVRLMVALAHFPMYWSAGLEQYNSGLARFDAYVYNDYATQLAEQGLTGSGPWEGINYSGIVYYYASLYYCFGNNPVFGIIVNCLAGVLTSVFLYKFILQFSSRRVATW